MSHQKISHEIAIPRSLTIILATLALGVIANALAPVFHIEQAGANLADRGSAHNPVHISVQGRTNRLSAPVEVRVQ